MIKHISYPSFHCVVVATATNAPNHHENKSTGVYRFIERDVSIVNSERVACAQLPLPHANYVPTYTKKKMAAGFHSSSNTAGGGKHTLLVSSKEEKFCCR